MHYYSNIMEKKLSSLLSVFKFEAVAADGKSPLDLDVIGMTPVTDVVFDSRKVTPGALFFALPGLMMEINILQMQLKKAQM